MHDKSPKMGYTYMYEHESRLIEPVSKAALLVHGFSPKLGFFANFICTSLTLTGRQIVRLLHGMKSGAAKLRWAQAGRAALRICINEQKKTSARSAVKTHYDVPYASRLDLSSLFIFESLSNHRIVEEKMLCYQVLANYIGTEKRI